MAEVSKEQDVYRKEFQILSEAKEIADTPGLTKDELLKEYTKLISEYDALLKRRPPPAPHEHSQAINKGNCREEPDGRQDVTEEITALKDRLLSKITHEFLTPLNLIITPLEQMIAKSRGREQKRTLSMMHRNGQRLLVIISQVLELLKLDNRKMKLNASRQNIVPFLKGIMASFELLAEQQEVVLNFQAGSTDIPLYFDAEKISEVVCNMIMNSLNYTPSGGWMKWSVIDMSAESIVISLQHIGSEISLDRMGQVFERFPRMNRQFEHSIAGPGIGLFLAREYVKLHRGTITVESGPDKGPKFVICLPKGKDHLGPDDIRESPGASAAMEKGQKISERYAYMVQLERDEALEAVSAADDSPDVDKENRDRDIVLVVEDSPDMRGFIKNLLAGEGFYVAEAADGKQGLALARDIIPDIIISDIVMPEVSGYQLCKELKKDIKTSHVPIILLSVKFSEDEIVSGLEAGADDYITKPFSMEILLSRIKNLIKMRRQLQQRIRWETVTHPDELGLSSIDNSLLKKIQQTTENSLSDPEFGIDGLADALQMSRASLHRKVRALTGQSPNKFIQSYRLKRSLDLLKSNYGNVTEVAYMVGFSSSAYFTKCFKAKFKRLPSDFQLH